MDFVFKRTLTPAEIKNCQDTGKHPIIKDVMLETRYADRWEMCDKLFSQWEDTYLAKETRRVLSENGQGKYYFVNTDEDAPMNFDVYPVPENVEVRDRDSYILPQRTEKDILEHPYMSRTKFIVKTDKLKVFYHQTPINPLSRYFYDMLLDFIPVLDYYRETLFSSRPAFYSLNVIRYEVPFASTDKEIDDHRLANALLWGVEHYDQSLCGIHLGESHDEFQVYNRVNEEWEYVDFDTPNYLFMFGDKETTKTDWEGTYHRMTQKLMKTDKSKVRYSIIIDVIPTDEDPAI